STPDPFSVHENSFLEVRTRTSPPETQMRGTNKNPGQSQAEMRTPRCIKSPPLHRRPSHGAPVSPPLWTCVWEGAGIYCTRAGGLLRLCNIYCKRENTICPKILS